jgi:hypothetical protein
MIGIGTLLYLLKRSCGSQQLNENKLLKCAFGKYAVIFLTAEFNDDGVMIASWNML